MKTKSQTNQLLEEKYPPSKPCDCPICKSFCKRPGWWTVEEARRVIRAGYAKRMMLEMSPDLSYGVLSPAFKGCEGFYAIQKFAKSGCNFLKEGLCELYHSPFMPLECRFCHHMSGGMGEACHNDIGDDWNSKEGQCLVRRWLFINNLSDLSKRH